MRNASLPIMALTREVTKPAESFTTHRLLAHAPRHLDRGRDRVRRRSRGARTISTSFIFGTGLKKCMPSTTRPGRFVAAAISVMERAEVFVASTTCSRHSSSSRAKMRSLRPMSSGTASITKSAPATAASKSAVAPTRARAASFAAGASLPRATPSSRSLRIRFRARSRAPADIVVEEGAEAAERRGVGDAAAHLTRADDGDGLEPQALTPPLISQPPSTTMVCPVM